MAKKNRAPHSNKYEHLSTPQAQLDLHLATSKEAKDLVDEFIRESIRNKLQRVLIITGKGAHSKNGEAVIRPIIEKLLRKHEEVESVTTARRDRGGEGALEVKLYN
ncbi:Smr/MutS family protein [Patescibacteria group bacterium]|nr:Smr/MutS family protein [Patescibacteria group bacterium]MBU1702879.1 Smr/MutS family protein [Patescibacteria group bacterium]MBU1953364.1 Smr/MutS family protein [Patescibacteria group bacterium]